MKLGIESYRRILKTLIRLDDSAHKIALSFAVGVYIAVSPFFGIHTILAIVVSLIFRLNKISTIAGSWVNMPWSAPFVYYFEYKLGCLITGVHARFHLKPFTLEHYLESGRNAFWSIFIGSVITGVVLSIVFYFIVRYLIELYRRRKYVSTKG